MEITPAELRKIARGIIQKTGSTPEEAEIVSDHLVKSNLAGHDSHGVGMIPIYIKNLKAGLLKPNSPVKLIKDLGNILMFDGQKGYGQRVAKEATEKAIERCKELGLVMYTLRNAHHVGRVGTYGEMSMAAGFVAIHFVNVTDHRPFVAPFRGSDPRYNTNPICIAIPGSDKTPSFLLDMATSGMAMGKTREAMNKGERVAKGRLIDYKGRPTNDPAVMWNEPYGSLLPFGEYKGYGLAIACELLAGVLGGGGTLQPGNPQSDGIINSMMAIVIDPDHLVERAWFNHEIAEMIKYVKASPPAKSDEPVLVAGDPERLSIKERAISIPIKDAIWEAILASGKEIGFDPARIG